MIPNDVDSVIPGSPIYYNPKRINRRRNAEEKKRQHQPPERKKRKTQEDQVDTYA